MLLTRVMCSCKFYVTLIPIQKIIGSHLHVRLGRKSVLYKRQLISFDRFFNQRLRISEWTLLTKKAFVASHCERVSCG